jgi:hypothetical protein
LNLELLYHNITPIGKGKPPEKYEFPVKNPRQPLAGGKTTIMPFCALIDHEMRKSRKPAMRAATSGRNAASKLKRPRWKRSFLPSGAQRHILWFILISPSRYTVPFYNFHMYR